MGEKLKLDIGCGDTPLNGYVPIDRTSGHEAYPLKYPDGSVSVIRAVHILEHFEYRDTAKVLAEWVRVLEDGGILRVSVPDFSKLVEAYSGTNDEEVQVEQAIMGAHTDENDFHKAIFNKDKLTLQMRQAGLGAILEWETSTGDTASAPISLNLQGVKGAPNPEVVSVPLSVSAVMSVPRLGFMDNFFSVFRSLIPLKIPIHKYTGAFWGQCLERSMAEVWNLHQPDAILTIDYDTIFSRPDLEMLMQLMIEHPDADAICAMQMSRGGSWPLLTKYGPGGKATQEVPMSSFASPLCEIATGHFGLTLIRTSKLRQMPHPWFLGVPNIQGEWGEKRVDDDIYFWKKWEKMGFKLFQANRIPVAHAELMLMWPGFGLDSKIGTALLKALPGILTKDGKLRKKPDVKALEQIQKLREAGRHGKFKTLFQGTAEYWEKGKPEGCWV